MQSDRPPATKSLTNFVVEFRYYYYTQFLVLHQVVNYAQIEVSILCKHTKFKILQNLLFHFAHFVV